LYNFFIDESGVEGFASNQARRSLDDDWFTSGGIIVNETSAQAFEQIHNNIIQRFFNNNGITLPRNFRLHYHELRQIQWPYNQLPNQQRWRLADEVFDAITSINCHLISASVNKPNHRNRYDWAVNVRAYSLLLCLERFQYFLEDENEEGQAVYEQFTNNIRRRMTRELIRLQDMPTFPLFTNLDNIRGRITNGDPIVQRVLQFSDFFVYSPHIRLVNNLRTENRWRQVRHKYFNIDGGWNRNGYVVIR